MHVDEQVFGVKMERLDEVGLKCPSDIHVGSGERGWELGKVRARSADSRAMAGKIPRAGVGETKENRGQKDESRGHAGDMPPEQRMGVRWV